MQQQSLVTVKPQERSTHTSGCDVVQASRGADGVGAMA
jgi:hypothetical protein